MRGEELQGLSIEELQQLESSLEAGLSRVIEKKGKQLMEENARLRQRVEDISNGRRNNATADSENIVYDEGQSSESVNACNSIGLPQDYESSDTSLKLG
ncbi:UNVERIFIED_CONTAM: MADS-box transcription factor 55 [Sesamum angustifolium]|uniref:MADS-box transcription factor 55 n=1 Tax=Sesamum angustifolium TaxID=2727405 RepID=A0AAW2RNQ0_9LAMI